MIYLSIFTSFYEKCYSPNITHICTNRIFLFHIFIGQGNGEHKMNEERVKMANRRAIKDGVANW